MAAAKKPVKMPAKKRKIRARDIEVGNRTLEAVLIDLAERSARAEEIVAEARQRSARAEERSARAEERSARAEERSARAEELAQIALDNIGALLRDFRAYVERTDRRIEAVENAAE